MKGDILVTTQREVYVEAHPTDAAYHGLSSLNNLVARKEKILNSAA